jgi:16S rRNA (cytosine1407-C5)-methyltransferase
MTRQKTRKKQPKKENTLEKSLARYRVLLDPQGFDLLLAELEKPLFGGLRLNTLIAGVSDLQHWCAKYGWQVEPVPFCDAGYRLLGRDINPGSTLEHRMGAFYLQDTASMLPPELFDFIPESQPLILDMAASPGGKTTHLTAKTADLGLVIANDASRSRIPALRTVLQTWGSVNTAVTCLPGESMGSLFPESFDAVLLDAPCSMDGLRSTEAHPLRPITENERASLAHRQIALLRSALQAARPGGQVVYSTCTLAPEEDEAVLDDVLKEYPGQIEIEDLSSEKSLFAPALGSTTGQVFHPAVQNAFRLWPHTLHTIGFFAARLRKTGTLKTPEKTSWLNLKSGFELMMLSTTEKQLVFKTFENDFGVDLSPVLEKYQLIIGKKGKTIQLIPEKLSDHFPALPWLSAGMTLAEETPGGLEVSHEFCARFADLITSPSLVFSEQQAAAWLRGEDIPRADVVGLPAHKIVIIRNEDGIFLGRGRVTSDRIKNLLPRRVVL